MDLLCGQSCLLTFKVISLCLRFLISVKHTLMIILINFHIFVKIESCFVLLLRCGKVYFMFDPYPPVSLLISVTYSILAIYLILYSSHLFPFASLSFLLYSLLFPFNLFFFLFLRFS